MRCLCYAKFLSNGSIPPGEVFAHLGAKWTCIEDTNKTSNKNRYLDMNRNNRFLHHSIVFITDCKSVEQLTSDLETMPGAGLSNIEVFPVPEIIEY